MRKWVNERHFWMFLRIRFSFLLGGPPWQSNFTRSSRSWLSEVRICHLYFRDLLIWSLKLAVFTQLLTPGMEVRDGRRLRQARPAAGIFSWVSLGWFACAQTLICFWTIFISVDYIHPIIRVLDCIECSGPRSFLRDGFPCVRYTNHYFLTGVTNLPR